MASYTMQLREYIEQATQNTNTMSARDRIEAGRTKLFDFDYPIFDPNYKKVFETHFIRKFYMREIGFETEGLFKFNLETWLQINMPYFNKLFESELITFDPLTNTKIDTTKNITNDKKATDTRITTQTGTTEGTSSGSSTQDTNGTATESDFNRHLESNNPDTRLAITPNADGSGVIEYASVINEDKQDNTKTNTGHGTASTDETTNVTSNTTVDDSATKDINETEDYIESRLGKIGDQTYSSMLNEYRESFMRIENKIFNEMQELFMLVY